MRNTYCVYLTAYSGNKLPPFYIGSSSVRRVQSGYRGSVNSIKYGKLWKNELRNNPTLFTTHIVRTYHSRKEALIMEQKLQVALGVVKSSMYTNMSTATPNGCHGMDVAGENNPMFGKTSPKKGKSGYPHVETVEAKNERIRKLKAFNAVFWASDSEKVKDRRKKYSIRSAGENNPMFGKTGKDNPNYGRKNSNETKQKMSMVALGKHKTADHVKRMSNKYTVQHISGVAVTGVGLTNLCRAIGVSPGHMLYHFKHNPTKFFKGIKILQNHGRCHDPLLPNLSTLILPLLDSSDSDLSNISR